MTSMHGIALNVSNDLSYDSLINPCGFSDRGLTSLSRETGRAISIAEARDALLEAFAREFSLEWVPSTDAPTAHSLRLAPLAQDCGGSFDELTMTTETIALSNDAARVVA